MADESWSEYFEKLAFSVVDYAAHNPKEFLMYFFMALTPIMICSAVLAYLMIKELDQKGNEKKKKATKQSNLAKTRRKAVKRD